MKKNQSTARRILSLFLVLVMLCTIQGLTVFAKEETIADASKEQQEEEQAEEKQKTTEEVKEPDSNPNAEPDSVNPSGSPESEQNQQADLDAESDEETPAISESEDASGNEDQEQTEEVQAQDSQEADAKSRQSGHFSQKAGVQSASPANPVHHCTKEDDGSDYTDWSYVYFGSYPQTEVTGDALTSAIVGASYDSNGDAWVNGIKYRRISKDDTNDTAFFGDSEYRYFKWERIKWKVLNNDGSTLFLAADKGLDCKCYNEKYASITWENCTLRSWLNRDFYGTAFSAGEQGAVVEQNVMNEDNPARGTEGGNDTRDKVYLLSIGEATNPDYGFCEDYNTESVSRRV